MEDITMSLMHYVLDTIWGSQNEIIIFCVAFLIHRFVFRRTGWKPGQETQKSGKAALDISPVKASSRYIREVAYSSGCFAELQEALHANDFDSSLKHLASFKSVSSEDKDKSPMLAAMLVLLQHVIQMAIQLRSIPQLFTRLEQLDLLGWSLDTMLVECVRGGHVSDVQHVRAVRKTQKLEFGEAAYSFLIKDATKPGHSLSLFVEASSSRPPSKELLKVASEKALEQEDKPLAEAILQKLPSSPPADVACNLLRFYGKSSTNDEVLRIHREKFKHVDLSCDGAAMRVVALAAIHSSAMNVLNDLLATTPESAHVALVKEIAGVKQLPSALLVLKASLQKGTWLYNAAIEACIECRSIEDAEQVLSEAVKSGMADVTSYNMVVKAYSQTKRPQKARQVLDAMTGSGLAPNGATFNAMLDAAVQLNIETTWKVFEEMCAGGLQPNRITCTVLLKAMRPGTKPADIDRIMTVLDKIDEDIDDVLLSSIVDACIRANRPELLTARLKKYRASGRSTDILLTTRAHTYGNIIRAYGFVHDLDMVWEIWQEMLARQVTPAAVTLGCMVEALATNGDPDSGYELIEKMMKDEQWRPLVNAVIYCSVLKGYSHQKRFDRVWQVYQEMLGHKLQFSSNTYNCLIDACARNSEMGHIPALLTDMKSQNILPCVMTYGAIVKGCCQENRIEEAFAVVKDMVHSTGCRPDEIMYNTLLDGCARKGLYDVGMSVLEEMQQNGIAPTNFTLSVLVKLVTRSLIGSRAEKIEKAFEMCAAVSTKYKFRLNVHVYTNLVNTCILNKDLNRAFDTMEAMVSAGIRADVRGYQLLLRACVANNRPADAAGLLRAAMGLNGAHPKLAEYESRLLQPQGGLPPALIEETIEAIVSHCHQEKVAVELLQDFRSNNAVKLDPKLQFRLATDLLK